MVNEMLNKNLIGKEGSASELQTPALILDMEVFESNLQRMANHAATAKVNLRPHSKNHKCVHIAKRQMEAGALGICCAKLGEAEAMVKGGLDNILVTSPIVTPGGIERLLDLNEDIEELIVVVDNLQNVNVLSTAVKSRCKTLNVLVDLDPGLHRTGIKPGPEAVTLVHQVIENPGLTFRGLQAYAGNLMHKKDFAERRTASHEALAQIQHVVDELAKADIECDIVSGAGTGTFDIDTEPGVLTELQVGSYIFMDSQYNAVQGKDGQTLPFDTSLFVQMTVISNNTPGVVTTDAGFKSFAADADQPVLATGAPEEATYGFFGDEHGGVLLSGDIKTLELGTIIRAITPHCDPTVNLYDFIHVIKGDTLVDIWPIEARGCAA